MVHSDDLENDLNYSDDEGTAGKKEVKQKKRKGGKPGKIYQQEVDVNVFKINMGTLKDGGQLATGDPVFCKTCNAAFNIHSKIEQKIGLQQAWVCEFCMTINEVHLEEEEIPKTKEVTYILEAAA